MEVDFTSLSPQKVKSGVDLNIVLKAIEFKHQNIGNEDSK
jgi:hypothetical protein